jgi:hypothetical protein
MIYFTTFIFTLFFAHIAHAEAACGDVASPEDMYDLMYDNEQLVLDDTFKVMWSDTYDNPNGSTGSVTCSNLDDKYPTFEDFPDFPYLGASYDIKQNPSNCGKCWKLTNRKSGRFIYFTAIDGVNSGFKISKHAFADLNVGIVDPPILYAYPVSVGPKFCYFERKN